MQLSLFRTCPHCAKTKLITDFYRNKSEKDGWARICRSCQDEYGRAYSQTEKGKESLRERSKKYKALHKDRVKQTNAKRDPSKYTEHRREYRLANKEKLMEYDREWKAKHPQSKRLRDNKRRAQIEATKTLTESEWLSILDKYNRRCCYCGSSDRITLDHWMPLCRGGSHTSDNVVPACKSCNSRKHKRTGEEYFALLGKPVSRL